MKRIILILICLAGLSWVVTAQSGPLANISHDPGLCCIFHRWGFIGDSLCSGEHEYFKEDGKKAYREFYEYSWGQRICAAIGGATGTVYSQGGETAPGWIKNFWDYPRNHNGDVDAKKDPKQAYIMALGCNDRKNTPVVGSVATDVNMEDYHKNADSFAGAYAGIIQRIRSIKPDCYFFVVTMPNSGNEKNEVYNQVIRDVAARFERVYLIDLYRYAPSYAQGSEFREKYFLGGHLNAAGYQQTAWMFMTYINHIIETNPRDFDKVAFTL